MNTPAAAAAAPIALLDACVLYPAQLRSLLMYLSLNGLFRARWTEHIHDEWSRSVLRDHPDMTPAQLARTRQLMDAHAPDALVSGYEPLIDTLDLPDPDDRHVLAAAIHAGAGLIITCNLNDFPPDRLAPHGVQARHPDEFVSTDLTGSDPSAVCAAARHQRAGMQRPAKTVDEYLAILLAAGLTRTVEFLRTHADQI